ncbi:hypothetical protein F2Q69_00022036 [Brassica cretica]|uniref:Uncharacterized protein n=1 Tax=Brassica cretica TaxID=69181 RepID=A0A8S9Q257_BRACR|nr:hypothetical protein F2Q69_00022036 [Brassica cretica]
MIKYSSQHATVEPSMKQNIRRRSKLTLKHRSTMPTRNRSTVQKENRSTVVHAIGRTTTTIPSWRHTPETPCIQRTMIKFTRKNELHSIEPLLMRKIDFSTILLGKGMRHRST